ncbi:MAG: GT-D fold domain-containing glycosyltransferase [Ruminococcus flavefaciens]|nr:GT-D fold domain-containing glycosyltransferase [Ruminococcus flavefaciens]
MPKILFVSNTANFQKFNLPFMRDLRDKGWRVFDIGHLDSEYEWFRMGAKKRIEISGKHSAEVAGSDIGVCNDADYKKQIMTVIEEGLYEI